MHQLIFISKVLNRERFEYHQLELNSLNLLGVEPEVQGRHYVIIITNVSKIHSWPIVPRAWHIQDSLEGTFKINEPDIGGICWSKRAEVQSVTLFIDSQLVSGVHTYWYKLLILLLQFLWENPLLNICLYFLPSYTYVYLFFLFLVVGKALELQCRKFRTELFPSHWP